MAAMQGRVVAGVGAWVIGATTATALCMLAVSFIDRDMTTNRGPVLSGDDVARSLAEPPSSAVGSGPQTTPAPNTPTAAGVPGTAPDTAANQLSNTAPGSSASAPHAPSTAASSVRVLSSPGGTVSARCEGTQAYLISWSPGQGYRVAGSQRGPARVATVVFAGQTSSISLRVRCSNGIPTPSTGGDDYSGGSE